MRSASLPFVLACLISFAPIVLPYRHSVGGEPIPQTDNAQRDEPFEFTMREWGFYESQTGWGMIPAAVLRFPVDRAGLEALDQLRTHKRLCIEVHGADATDPVLEKIAALDNLRILQLQNTVVPESDWKHLAGHRGLRLLMAANVEVKPDVLPHIAAIPNLEWLMLNSIQIDDEALRHLTIARNLTLLSLRDAVITDAGIAHLRGLTELRGLSLPDSRLTDAGLAHLKHLERLIHLEVNADNEFTAAGVVHLKDLEDLQSLGGIPDALITAHLLHAARHHAEDLLRNAPVALEIFELPLEAVCEDLAQFVPLQFAAADDVRKHSVTIQVRWARAFSAIELLCELHGFAWTLEPDCVTFSSRNTMRNATESQMYDLADLLGAEPGHTAEVARVIPKLIAPESWSAGSTDSRRSATANGSRLTVVHSREVQRDVKRLLEDFGERGNRFPSVAEREIADLLDGPATLKVSDMPLDRLLSNFPDRRLAVVLDRPGFAEDGISTAAPVTVQAQDVPLKHILDLVFEPLGLAWTVRQEVVVVFPTANEAEMLEPRVYHVGGILTKGGTAAYVAERVRDELAFAHLNGRYAADAFNRVVVRASFREHQAIQSLVDELARE
jgi:hypothetical protein